MKFSAYILALLMLLLACSQNRSATPAPQFNEEFLRSYAEEYREENVLPGMIVDVRSIDPKIHRQALTVAVGETPQKNSGTRPLQPNELLSIASLSKAMTSALVMHAIEAGTFQLSSTLAQLLPNTAMRDEYKNVTLSMLMTNLGGMPSETPLSVLGYSGRDRTQLLSVLLNRAPDSPIGTQVYSTYSFVTLGTILETYSGKKWEELANEELFTPLGMSSCKFQSYPEDQSPQNISNIPWLNSDDLSTILWGNDYEENPDGWTPLDPTDPSTYYDPLWNPGAGVFCTIEDWQKFVSFETEGFNGKIQSDVLSMPSSYQQLFFAPPASYIDYSQGAWTLFDYVRPSLFSAASDYGASGGTVIQTTWDPQRNLIVTAFTNGWAWDGTDEWLDEFIDDLSKKIPDNY